MKFFKQRVNFVDMLCTQCKCTEDGFKALYNYCMTNEESYADEVIRIEEEGDMSRRILTVELNRAFITPIERKDIFDLSRQLDEILDYAKTTIDEMRLFNILPDEAMGDMIGILCEICKHISIAVANIEKHPQIAREEALTVKGLENTVGMHYYSALANLFENADLRLIFKYREVYRHINTTSDLADRAMDSLLDILLS